MIRPQLVAPALLALVLAASALPGCSAFQRKIDPAWSDAEVETSSETVIYEVVHMSLQKAGYPVGIGADRAERRIETGWYLSEAPFKGDGYRQKAIVEYEPSGARSFRVSVRVRRETNESLRPLDPRYAEWTEAEDNVGESQRILQYVRSFLSDGSEFEVGAPPRRR